MKKFMLILTASTGIAGYLCAQSAGDYRSIANGTWNDATKWERYNGISWISTATYPGESPGSGTVTIAHETEIRITAVVAHPIANLLIDADYPDVISSDCETPIILPSGVLTFSAETGVTLAVTGDVRIIGQLKIDNQNGAKTHTLIIGHDLSVGIQVYDASCYGYPILGSIESINLDDKLGVIFMTTDPGSSISSIITPDLGGLSLQDVTFNCVGVNLYCYLVINGNATFNNGIVRYMYGLNQILFLDGATVTGGSAASYVEGGVTKIGDDTFTFPTGDDGVYGPVTIAGLTSQERFSASYLRNSGFNAGGITDPGLSSVSNCEYWSIGRDGNGNNLEYPLDITIGWTTATRCGTACFIDDAANVTLAHSGVDYGINTWDSHGGTGTGSASNGSVTWNDLTNIGVFTLGNVRSDCSTPSGLMATNITTNSATVSWSSVPGAMSYDVEYRPKNMMSWINLATATLSISANLTNLLPGTTYDWKVKANCSSTASLYKQTQFTTLPRTVCNDAYETNNNSNQAKTINIGSIISAGISSANDMDWFKITTPNNSNTNLEVTLADLPADYDLYVYNKSLKLVGSSVNSGTSNDVVIYNSTARKAIYFIKVAGKNGAYNTSQCYSLLVQVSNSAGSASNASIPQQEINEEMNKELLYPNPASEFVYVNFHSLTEGLVDIQIINSIGQLLKQHPVNANKGRNQIKIQLSDIRPGMYILRISKGELNIKRKFVIER